MEEVIITSDVLEVSADNYEEFDLEIDPDRLGEKLIQENVLKGTHRQFQFYAKNYLFLKVLEKKKSSEKNYRVNIPLLSSEPIHNKVVIWKWLLFTLLTALLTCGSIYLAIEKIINFDYCLIAGIITSSLTFIFFLAFIYHMRDEYVFESCFGRAKLFLIENKKPDQQKFDNFFINLKQTIGTTQSVLSISDRLVAELKMCRRLRDEGVISGDIYTRVRTTIFEHKQYKT